MAYKRKGHLTVSADRGKHLRKEYYRVYWKGERKAAKKLIRNELIECSQVKACGHFGF
jgi:hypothetical protein